MSQKVNIKKLNPNACIPTYGTEFSAGADLYSGMSEAVTVMPGTTEFIKTGIAMEIPLGRSLRPNSVIARNSSPKMVFLRR